MFHLFTDYVDLCFSRRNRKCVYFAPDFETRTAIPKILIVSWPCCVNTDLLYMYNTDVL